MTNQNAFNMLCQFPTFKEMWHHYIKPLEGKTIPLAEGDTNKILKVDNSGIERETSELDEWGNPNNNRIPISIFKFAYARLLQEGKVSRAEINEQKRWCSSGVIAVFAHLPFVKLTHKPITLWLLLPPS